MTREFIYAPMTPVTLSAANQMLRNFENQRIYSGNLELWQIFVERCGISQRISSIPKPFANMHEDDISEWRL